MYLMDKSTSYVFFSLINVRDFRKVEKSLEKVKNIFKIHTKKFIIREYVVMTKEFLGWLFEKGIDDLHRKLKAVIE